MTPWIKIEVTTPDKPEVIGIAAALGLDEDTVMGKLVRLWSWADLNSIPGNAVAVTESFIDRYTRQPGFARALRAVGWIMGEDGHITFPNFDHHNGKSAKTRATTAYRVAEHRRNAPTVTPVTPPSAQTPLPEKERERESTSTTTLSRGCTLDEAHAYATAYTNGAGLPAMRTIPLGVATLWHDNRSALGWITVKGGVEVPIADWQADLRSFAHYYANNETSKLAQPLALNTAPKRHHANPQKAPPSSANPSSRYAS